MKTAISHFDFFKAHRRFLITAYILYPLLITILMIIVPGYVASKRGSMEETVLSTLITLREAEKGYYLKNGKYASISELNEGMHVDVELLRKASKQYRFEIRARETSYEIVATPREYGKIARMSYYTDERGKIYEGDKGGAEANTKDCLLE